MSDEPRRLLDDPESSELLRNDLARVQKTEVDYDATAGLSRLRGAIASGGGSAGDPGSSTSTGATTSVATGKLATIAVAAAAAIATGWFLLKQPEVIKTPALEPASSSSASVVTNASARSDSTEEIPTLSLSALPTEPSAKSGAETPAPSASVSPEERLRAEMKQLADVRSALASSPAKALELANQGHRDFKSGVFYQEREALAISAMVRLGQTAAAKTRAQNFLKAYPKGPYSERVRTETGVAGP